MKACDKLLAVFNLTKRSVANEEKQCLQFCLDINRSAVANLLQELADALAEVARLKEVKCDDIGKGEPKFWTDEWCSLCASTGSNCRGYEFCSDEFQEGEDL